MFSPQALVLGFYFAILICLSVYGVHRTYLVYLYTRYRRNVPASGDRKTGNELHRALPYVTVQLPIYNEMYVAERLISAVAAFDYPPTRLEIQVLDDSTDETCQIAQRAVEHWVKRGRDIHYLPRRLRTGFKAGALAAGLRHAKGELIAIFDADFVPSPDFLRRSVPAFIDPHIGMVQARWEHLNRDYSLLTRVQAMLLDAHFVLEHGARNRAGCFFNFNGTAGIWRRVAIESAGGWHHDTLTEDLDLSYRAQLEGWRFRFLPDVPAPAELPVEVNAFKVQQHRWVKGSVQTCRKLLPAVLRAELPGRIKLEAALHLTANFNYLLMTALALVVVPVLFIRQSMEMNGLLLVELPLFGAATLSVVNFYAVSQRELRADWLARLKYIPALIALGIGLSVNNTRAVLGALSASRGDFARTPKYGVTQRSDGWTTKRYRQMGQMQPFVEIGLGFYFTAAVLYAVSVGMLASLPFLMLFQMGFLFTGLLSLAQQTNVTGLLFRAHIPWRRFWRATT